MTDIGNQSSTDVTQRTLSIPERDVFVSTFVCGYLGICSFTCWHIVYSSLVFTAEDGSSEDTAYYSGRGVLAGSEATV